MENVFSVSEFKTDSLHKYMRPVYAEMNLHLSASEDEKKRILPTLFPIFFRRMREYRGIEIERIAEKYKIPLERLRLVELGQHKIDREIESAYLHECGGYAELAVFERQIREFQNPSFKDSRSDHALIASKAGMVVPGLDYKKLTPENGSVLPFVRRNDVEH